MRHGLGRFIGGALANAFLVAASLLVIFIVLEIALNVYEDRLLRAMNVDPDTAVMDHTAYAANKDDPNRGGQFDWNPDGSSLINIKSSNKKLVYEMRPNTEAYGKYIATNSFGFRDREFSLAKPDGVYRIIAVGDSLAFGWQVRGEETFPKALERILNADAELEGPFEVYNMGVSGYGADQELEVVKSKGLQFRPDCIVIAYCINDHRIGADAGLWRHFTRGRTRTLDFIKLKWMQVKENLSEKNMMERSYEDLAALSEETGIAVLATIFPHVFDTKPNTAIEAYCRGLGLLTVDLFHAYNRVGVKDALLHDGLHPSPLGHEIAGQELHRILKTACLLPAR